MKVLDLNTLLRDLDKMLHQVISEDIELVMRWLENTIKRIILVGDAEPVIQNLAQNRLYNKGKWKRNRVRALDRL